jgi:TfoX/Sxy family transcriptional regulator of competence genes
MSLTAKRRASRPRPKLPHVSEEMKRLAELLEAEMLAWPNVTSRPMFGLNGIYRGPNIFAVLPRTRAMDVPDSIAFRLLKRPRHIMAELRKDKRIVASTPEAKWISFVMQSDSEIHAALKWLALAYRQAVKS